MILTLDSTITPELSVIIVNWKSKDFVIKCLDSLQEHCTDIKYEVIVVDGASFDGCDIELKKHHPKAHYIQSTKNIGFGRCNNLGFKSARGKFILLLNPDTEVTENSIQALIETLIKSNPAGIVGAKLLNKDGSLQVSSVQALPTPLNQALDSNFLRKALPKSSLWKTFEAYNSQSPIEVEAVSGACMLLKRSTFQNIGGFTEDYFMYAEDMDLCYKTRKLGLKNIFTPTSQIFHFGGGSTSEQSNLFSDIKKRESLSIYFKRNKSKKAASTYKALQGVSSLFRIFLTSLKPSSKASRNKWKAILKWSQQKEFSSPKET